MAKKNPGDILTGDWNPLIGCRKYSTACQNCWYLEGIFPWQQRLGIIPSHVKATEAYLFEKRMSVENLKLKSGIVGICQNGDLFWDEVPNKWIHRVFDIIEKTVPRKRKRPTYLFWTKRARRMAGIVRERYPERAPDYMAFAVSVEDQQSADERLPYLLQIPGKRIIAAEPLLEEVDLNKYVPETDWLIVGSETGGNARPLEQDWVRALRDTAIASDIPFFIKQMGNSHKDQLRELDSREWCEFPVGFEK